MVNVVWSQSNIVFKGNSQHKKNAATRSEFSTSYFKKHSAQDNII